MDQRREASEYSSLIPGFRKLFHRAILAGMLWILSGPLQAQTLPSSEIRIVHIANEGFLIMLDGRKVLIDALFGAPSNSAPPPEVLERIEIGEEPFDNVDLILVTHNHSDHFSPESVLRALSHSPNTALFTTPQAVSDLRSQGSGFDSVKARIQTVELAAGQDGEVAIRGLRVRVMSTRHDGMPDVQNFMYRVSSGASSFFHEGDADLSGESLARFAHGPDGVDVAFLHYGYLLSSDWMGRFEETLHPRHLIPMHISPNQRRDADQRLEGILQERDNVHYLRAPLDEVVIRRR